MPIAYETQGPATLSDNFYIYLKSKVVIRNSRTKNDRQNNDQKKKDKRTINDVKILQRKLKIEQHEPH
jgi:hypothetical protein